MSNSRIIAIIMSMIIILILAGCSAENNATTSNYSDAVIDGFTTEAALSTQTQDQKTTEAANSLGTEPSGSAEVEEPTSTVGPYVKPTETTTTEPKPTNPTQPSESKPTNPPAPTEPKPTNPPTPTNPPHTHNYTATVVAPTCTNKGYTEYKCSCGASYKDNYKNALGHDYKVTSSGTATCTSGGYTEKKCTRCGDTQRTQTAALDHNYQEVGTTPATCTAPSTVQYKCSRCGDTYQQTVGNALGHNWVHHDAETHWVHGIKCYCGAIFWTYEDWCAHQDQYIDTDEADAHAGYKNYDEEIIDKPAYRQCSRCGLIEYY